MPTYEVLDDALLHAGRSVPAINRLGGGAIVRGTSGRPTRTLGADAAVYQLRQPHGRSLALRCLLAEPPDPLLAERYRLLASSSIPRALRSVSPRPLVGNLAYIADGLALPAPDFRSVPRPLIAMDWVDGTTLLETVDQAAANGDGATLTNLADAWLTVCEALRNASFVHDDLTAGNILVRPDGGIVLVDYDTCFWPGGPRPVNGKSEPHYQHPSGKRAISLERRDDFPALLIYASLRALSQEPALRQDQGDRPGTRGGALLFSQRDLKDPDKSRLFRELVAFDDAECRALAGALRLACLDPVDTLPPFPEVAAAARASAWRASRTARPAPVAPPPPEAPAAPPSVPTNAHALERQRHLTRLNSLLMTGDDSAALRYWRESGLADDPEAAHDIGAKMAEIGRRQATATQPAPPPPPSQRAARPTPRPVERPIRPAPSQEPPIAAAASPLIEIPVPIPSVSYQAPPTPAPRPRDIAQLPRQRDVPPPPSEELTRLRAALAASDAATVGRLWPRIRDHAAASALAPRVSDLLSAAAGAKIARSLEQGDDEATVGAVREAEAAGIAVTAKARRAARAAGRRLATRQSLSAALISRDHQLLTMLVHSGRLVALGPMPPDTQREIQRAMEWPRLILAMEQDDDHAILAAFNSDLFAEPGVLSPADRDRIELAHQRTAWVDRVRRSLRRRDSADLRTALEEEPDSASRLLSQVEWTRAQRFAQREEAVDELQEALREGPDAAIVEALNRVMTTGASLPAALDWSAISGVVDRVTLADAIQRAAAADPPDYQRLARLLPAARAAAREGGPAIGSGLDLDKLEADVLRAAHRSRLQEALASGDDHEIAAAAIPDTYGAIATLAPEDRARVTRIIHEHRQGAKVPAGRR